MLLAVFATQIALLCRFCLSGVCPALTANNITNSNNIVDDREMIIDYLARILFRNVGRARETIHLVDPDSNKRVYTREESNFMEIITVKSNLLTKRFVAVGHLHMRSVEDMDSRIAKLIQIGSVAR